MPLTETQVDDVLWAARSGDVDALKEVLAEIGSEDALSAAVKCSNHMGNTPLHFAAANGHLELIKFLKPGLTLRVLLAQNDSGNTPLHWAAFNGYRDVAAALVDFIEVGEREDPETAQHLRSDEDAREHERHKKMCAQIKGEDQTAEDVAAEQAHHDEQLSERAIWDVRNNAGHGPMTEAQMADREAVVRMLLARLARADGVDVKETEDEVQAESTAGERNNETAAPADGPVTLSEKTSELSIQE